MPVLADPRWEKFAQLMADGATPSEAYDELRFEDGERKGMQSSGKRMFRFQPIIERIAELVRGQTEAVMAMSAIDEAWLTRQTRRVYEECMGDRPPRNGDTEFYKPALALRALDLMGKLAGLYSDDERRAGSGDRSRAIRELKGMTDKQLGEFIDKALARKQANGSANGHDKEAAPAGVTKH